MIILTNNKKPIPQATKGMPIRVLALEQFENEIHTLYTAWVSGEDDDSSQPFFVLSILFHLSSNLFSFLEYYVQVSHTLECIEI